MPAYKDKERNTWCSSFYYTDINGEKKHKTKRGFKLKRDAEKWESDFLNSRATDCTILFKNLVTMYFQTMQSRIRPTTLSNKQFIINTKLLPYFAEMPLCDITPLSVVNWQNSLLNDEKGYSQTYLKTVNNQLSAIFNFAVKYYNLKENPCRKAGSMGKKNADSMKIWTTEDFEKFIEQVKLSLYKVAFTTLFYTGMRSGELMALTVDDILPNRSITINKSLSVLKRQELVHEPKTPKSKRIITIPEKLYVMLQEHINALYDANGSTRLFPVSKCSLANQIKWYAPKADVDRIRVHDLRHSHASLLIEMGCSVILISERLGHDRIETTLQTYSHLYPNKHEQIASQLNELIK